MATGCSSGQAEIAEATGWTDFDLDATSHPRPATAVTRNSTTQAYHILSHRASARTAQSLMVPGSRCREVLDAMRQRMACV